MTFYIGVDLHPYQQTLCWCDEETGETGSMKLFHDIEKVREFYSSIDKPAIVGIEASSRAGWFEKVVEEAGHKLFVGNPVSIRKTALSRHKNDRIDAEHILWLLIRGEFPAVWRRPRESNDVLEVLRLRTGLVRQRNQVYNRLQALARDVGMPKAPMKSVAVQQVLKSADVSAASALCREQLFSMLWYLNDRVAELETWLKSKAAGDDKAQLLMTQKGVGYLTALAFMKAFYKRLLKKKPRAVAKTAIARKLLVKLSIMLRDNITAEEFDLRGRTVGNARKLTGLEMAVK